MTKRNRPKHLVTLPNHDLGVQCCAMADALDAGLSLDHPATGRGLRDLLLEAAARLHKDWPGEKPCDTPSASH